MPRTQRLIAQVAAAALGMAVLQASAQWSAGVALESDHRFRGVSLSRGEPVPRLNLAWEDAQGWYAGASATTVSFDPGRRQAALLGYAGRAQRWSSQWSGEIGLSAAHFAVDADADYAEVFAGLIAPRWNARLYGSPDYFGRGRHSAYAELNGGWPLIDSATTPWTIVAHAGVLRLFGHPDATGRRSRRDLRLGLSVGVTPMGLELQLAYVTSSSVVPYGPAGEQRRSTWVAGANWAF